MHSKISEQPAKSVQIGVVGVGVGVRVGDGVGVLVGLGVGVRVGDDRDAETAWIRRGSGG